MKVIFFPNVDKNDLDSGVMSEISWQRLLPFLEQAFAVKEDEEILGITISEYGVKAKFQTNNEARNLRAVPAKPIFPADRIERGSHK